MEEKKMMKEEELDQVAGGSLIGVITICHCGGKITKDCESRYDSLGNLEMKCPICGNWIMTVE